MKSFLGRNDRKKNSAVFGDRGGNMNKLLTLCQQFNFTFLGSIKINFKQKTGSNWIVNGSK